MKKNKFNIVGTSFLTGAVFGISLFAILSFSKSATPPLPDPQPEIIDTVAAKQLFFNYYNSPGPIPERVKGFFVDRLQLIAMNNLVEFDSTLAGFRLYLGKSDADEPVGIVVGVAEVRGKLSDVKNGRIYKTASVKSGPCPFICDESSPITNDH
jgi:hypothetical protein